MIVVFVSKNDEEFNRYKMGCGKVICRDLYHRPVSSMSASVNTKGATSIGKTSSFGASSIIERMMQADPKAAKNAEATAQVRLSEMNENLKPMEYMTPLESVMEYYSNGTFVVVIRSGDYINRLKQNSFDQEYEGAYIEDFLTIVGEVISESLPEWKDVKQNHEVRLLVHWGEVTNFLEEEEKFQKSIDQHNYKSLIGCKKLVFHELSSRRPSFNVDGEIKVPIKEEEVDSLIKCFRDEREFASVKDVLTAFVTSGKLRKRDIIGNFFARDLVRNDLRFAIKDSYVNWLKEWTLFREYLNAGDNKTAKYKALKMLSESGDKPRAFVSQLLTVPHLLSEDILT